MPAPDDLPPWLPEGLRLDEARTMLGEAWPASSLAPACWWQALVEALVVQSAVDPLTGLPNHRGLEQALARELDRVARSGEPALLMRVQLAGLEALEPAEAQAVRRRSAQVLRAALRPMDTVASLGAPGLALLLPLCPTDHGPAVVRRLQGRVDQLARPRGGGPAPRLTVGGAGAPAWVRSSSLLWLARAEDELLRAADAGPGSHRFEAPAVPEVVASVSGDEKSLLLGSPWSRPDPVPTQPQPA